MDEAIDILKSAMRHHRESEDEEFVGDNGYASYEHQKICWYYRAKKLIEKQKAPAQEAGAKE